MGLDFMDTHETDYEDALILAGFGKFHYLLLTVCGLIYTNTAIGITILSFVLPAATCDFSMTSSHKGWLSASPMLGMLFGSYFWGCLADTKGRKAALIATLLLDGICGLISSISQMYPIFLLFRFLNGFGVAGAMGICFPYLGEFQPTKYREKVLCWMEMFWTIGIIALPGIAWLIIPIDISIEQKGFTFHSWNLFVAVCAIPSILLALWLFAFPESPKFLLERGKADDALQVLRQIYVKNTGKLTESYSVMALKEKPALAVHQVVSDKLKQEEIDSRRPKKLHILLKEVWTQTIQLCRKPHLKNTALTCAIQFGLTSSYYTLMVWFPELFSRFESFEKQNPDETASVCEVSSIVLSEFSHMLTNNTICDSPVEQNVYIHTVIIGLACIPTSLWLPLCIHKLGAKFFLVFCLLAAGAITIGLYFVVNSTQNLILSCLFEALTSLSISVVYTVMVDLFPTNLRVMAAALALTFGRLGALVGNLIFGAMIDLNCVIPIILFSSMLVVSGLLCLLLPTTGQTALD